LEVQHLKNANFVSSKSTLKNNICCSKIHYSKCEVNKVPPNLLQFLPLTSTQSSEHYVYFPKKEKSSLEKGDKDILTIP
jgi:hypothetical protein